MAGQKAGLPGVPPRSAAAPLFDEYGAVKGAHRYMDRDRRLAGPNFTPASRSTPAFTVLAEGCRARSQELIANSDLAKGHCPHLALG